MLLERFEEQEPASPEVLIGTLEQSASSVLLLLPQLPVLLSAFARYDQLYIDLALEYQSRRGDCLTIVASAA